MSKNYFLPVYILIVLAITIAIAAIPDYNWDMLPYMSILEKMDGIKPFDKIHEDIYAQAKKNLPAKKYEDLVDQTDKYRIKMAQNSSAFETQLPYFDIKPIYLITAFIFYKIGCSLTYATVIPSLISFFLINIISFFWCRKFSLPSKILPVIVFFICVLAIPLGTRSNPDALSCVFLLTGSYFFLESEKLFIAILLFVFSILVRPENIILSFILYAIVLAGRWKKKVPLYVSLLYLGLLAISYYIPQKLLSNPGWSSLFYHAFVDNTVDPAIKQTITVPLYLHVMRENILNIKGIGGFVFLLGLSILLLQPKIFRLQKASLYKLYYIAVVAFVIVKLLLFPMLSFRFMIPSLLLIAFAIIKEIKIRFYTIKPQQAL